MDQFKHQSLTQDFKQIFGFFFPKKPLKFVSDDAAKDAGLCEGQAYQLATNNTYGLPAGLMKVITIFVVSLVLRPTVVYSQNNIYKGAGISYTVGVPTYNPGAKGSQVAIDTATGYWYEHFSPGGWRWAGDRIQSISGCAAPAYVPTKGQSRLVLNSCTPAQNGSGPELYQYQGSVWVHLNAGASYTAGTGISIAGTEITNTGDLSNTNELQTISTGTNTLTLSNSGGTVTVDTDPTNDITSLSGGTGISVSGSGNSRTITNTGDLSATNELQTLYISGSDITLSNGGGTVTVPGGGVTWPLLAPTSTTPNYSFDDYQNTGFFSSNGGISVVTDNGDAAINDLIFTLGTTTNQTGGGVQINCGYSENSTGGSVAIIAGGSTSGGGGGYSMYAGNGATSGGYFILRSGASAEIGGNMTLETGSGTNANGGNIQLITGVSDVLSGKIELTTGDSGSSGSVEIKTGGATGATSGLIKIKTGNILGETAQTGSIEIKTGDTEGFTNAGSIEIKTGYGLNSGTVLIESGVDKNGGRNNVTLTSWGVVFTPVTEAQRDLIPGLTAGMKIFCSDCTANDSSIGVEQTYNGSEWKSLW